MLRRGAQTSCSKAAPCLPASARRGLCWLARMRMFVCYKFGKQRHAVPEEGCPLGTQGGAGRNLSKHRGGKTPAYEGNCVSHVVLLPV